MGRVGSAASTVLFLLERYRSAWSAQRQHLSGQHSWPIGAA